MRTTILFMRHEDHRSQVLLPDAEERAIARGKKLLDLGYTIHSVVSSPLPRAIATAIAALKGYGNANVPFALEPRLGDFKTDPRLPAGALDQLKMTAKEKFGDESDASLAKANILTGSLHEVMYLRAEEGAEALLELVAANQGKTVLVTSHGVARMEIVLRYLPGFRGMDVLQILDELIDRGEVVKVTFSTDDIGVHFESSEPLALLELG